MRKLFITLLIIVGVIAPAMSMANVMLHMPAPDHSDLFKSSLSSSVVDSAAMPCHETESGELPSAEDLVSKHHHSTELEASKAECCEDACECPASGCSSQSGLVSSLSLLPSSPESYLSTNQAQYRSLSLSPQSPPPTR